MPVQPTERPVTAESGRLRAFPAGARRASRTQNFRGDSGRDTVCYGGAPGQGACPLMGGLRKQALSVWSFGGGGRRRSSRTGSERRGVGGGGWHRGAPGWVPSQVTFQPPPVLLLSPATHRPPPHPSAPSSGASPSSGPSPTPVC